MLWQKNDLETVTECLENTKKRLTGRYSNHNTHIANTEPLDMGVDSDTLAGWLANYDRDNITIGVVASHSSLQILHGARVEGFRTLGIAVGENRRRFYKAFPGAEPDEWLMLENYREKRDVQILERVKNSKLGLAMVSVQSTRQDQLDHASKASDVPRVTITAEPTFKLKRWWVQDAGGWV